MFYRILLFITIISHAACGQPTHKHESKPFAFVDSVLKKDKFTVENLDFEFPQEVQEILLRFQKAMAENKKWAEEYFSKNFKEGEGLPYNDSFGITKEEYQKIKDIDKSSPTVIVKSTSSLQINRTRDNLTFIASENNMKFIELLKIDFKNELVLFNNDTIPFRGEINAPLSTPFGEWHGYSWKKETSNLGDSDDLKMDKLISKIVEINFGRVKATGKSLFILKYKDFDKGQIKANLDVTCYLD
jgi:hypothetical protein